MQGKINSMHIFRQVTYDIGAITLIFTAVKRKKFYQIYLHQFCRLGIFAG